MNLCHDIVVTTQSEHFCAALNYPRPVLMEISPGSSNWRALVSGCFGCVLGLVCMSLPAVLLSRFPLISPALASVLLLVLLLRDGCEVVRALGTASADSSTYASLSALLTCWLMTCSALMSSRTYACLFSLLIAAAAPPPGLPCTSHVPIAATREPLVALYMLDERLDPELRLGPLPSAVLCLPGNFASLSSSALLCR